MHADFLFHVLVLRTESMNTCPAKSAAAVPPFQYRVCDFSLSSNSDNTEDKEAEAKEESSGKNSSSLMGNSTDLCLSFKRRQRAYEDSLCLVKMCCLFSRWYGQESGITLERRFSTGGVSGTAIFFPLVLKPRPKFIPQHSNLLPRNKNAGPLCVK